MKMHYILSSLFVAVLAFAQPVNVNKASPTELEKVKGVGRALAARIVDYRKANGPFKSLDDLTKVSGIGATTLERMKLSLTVSAPKLDLNAATAKELERLPGIGKVLAVRIVGHRKINGPFKSLNDLIGVKGVNDSMIGKLSGQLTVTAKTSPKVPKKLKVYRPVR